MISSSNILEIIDTNTVNDTLQTGDYSVLLDQYGLNHKKVDYYLMVGENALVQGWVLHLTAVASQLDTLLHSTIPFLKNEKIAFKIPEDKDTAKSLLNGSLGNAKLAKILSVYPDDEISALAIARELVHLTEKLKGPAILTDIYLGGTVYTRYGSINPIKIYDITGEKKDYIYDEKGELMKDPYSIPFRLPENITWPFQELASPNTPEPKRILHQIYKPLFLLKSDVRGNVYKALYLKGFLRLAYCVIKEGNKNMVSEEVGRDIHDRLAWQYTLHKELQNSIALPKIYDFFQEDGDTYLVMELVKGASFLDRIKRINFNIKNWYHISTQLRFELIDYLLKIIATIDQFHQLGYIHRDIAPGNFMINKKNEIVPIDIELAYSVKKGLPNPAFGTGTPGFMSPQQAREEKPILEDDIYGLGALMLTVLTGLTSAKFDNTDGKTLANNIFFFIHDADIAAIIASCLDPEPENRPGISIIRESVEKFMRLDANMVQGEIMPKVEEIDDKKLNIAIRAGLNGLIQSPIVLFEEVWYSKSIKEVSAGGHLQKEYSRYIGIHTGVGGTCYLVARAKIAGFSVEHTRPSYMKCWEFIAEECFARLPEVIPGLYSGAAGIALSLAEGIRAGLNVDDQFNRQRIYDCLNIPNDQLDLATGVAGQGIAVLRCMKYLGEPTGGKLLQYFAGKLLNTQQKDGSWLMSGNGEQALVEKNIGFGYGIAGILWSLLGYLSYSRDTEVEKATLKGLSWLIKRTDGLKMLFNKKMRSILPSKQVGDERKGIVLTFIKAFEVLQDDKYKKLVDSSLKNYAARITKINFTQDTGMAGLGEVYQEAYRVFKDKEWHDRTEWIANVYLHTMRINPDGSGYWIMDENSEPTADLMTGNSGIIHFLMRCLSHSNLGYRLLN